MRATTLLASYLAATAGAAAIAEAKVDPATIATLEPRQTCSTNSCFDSCSGLDGVEGVCLQHTTFAPYEVFW
jgi:hypothetical protein